MFGFFNAQLEKIKKKITTAGRESRVGVRVCEELMGGGVGGALGRSIFDDVFQKTLQ